MQAMEADYAVLPKLFLDCVLRIQIAAVYLYRIQHQPTTQTPPAGSRTETMTTLMNPTALTHLLADAQAAHDNMSHMAQVAARTKIANVLIGHAIGAKAYWGTSHGAWLVFLMADNSLVVGSTGGSSSGAETVVPVANYPVFEGVATELAFAATSRFPGSAVVPAMHNEASSGWQQLS